MKIVVDADGCPVVQKSIEVAKSRCIKIVLVCDTEHDLEKYDVEVVTVSQGLDSADFKIVNMLQKGDVVVTQDYGLASLCLSKGAFCLNQDGMEYNDSNIDSLLFFRHTAKHLRKNGLRFKSIPKRDKKILDQKFADALGDILGRG